MAFVRADTNSEVDYIFEEQNSFNLYTQDSDLQLRGKTLEFKWLANLSDGQTDLEICRFTIEFIGNNHLPYFKPDLGAYLQIYKQGRSFHWTFELPPFFDEDVNDTLNLSVDLMDIAEFTTFVDGVLHIEDLSSPVVPFGTFSLFVTLSDGVDSLVSHITVLIYEAPIYEDEFESNLILEGESG